jgi:hypothetical protein
MIVNVGLRRLVGAIQRLFNGASFSAPLTNTLVLERGTGSPTFTRATTGTVSDNEGILRTAIASEARFVGARRVRNWIQSPTENWSNAGWVKSGISVSGNRLTATAPNGTIFDGAAVAMGTGKTAMGSITLTRVTGTGNIDISLNGATTFTTVVVDGTRKSVVLTGNINGQFGIRIATSGDSVDATYAQLEDITGRTDQTTPSEYVSVGVLSAPFHGAGVDSVKYFNTTLTGALIPAATNLGYLAEAAATNLCLQSQTFDNASWTGTNANLVVTANSTVAPDGTTTADTITKSGGSDQALNQVITVASGSTYTYSLYVLKDATTSRFPEFYIADGGANQLYTQFNTSTGASVNRISSGTVSFAVESFSSTFWRIKLTALFGTTSASVGFRPAAGTTIGVFSAAATGAITAWGAQVELGSAATSYIPTTTVAVTRNADVLTYPSAGNISGTVGWCSAEVTSYYPNATQTVYIAGTGAGGYVAYHDADGALKLFDVSAARSLIAEAHPNTVPNKIAVTWGGVTCTGAVNGSAGSAQTFDGNISLAGSDIGIGSNSAGVGQIGGTMRNVRIGTSRQLSSSELQAITR